MEDIPAVKQSTPGLYRFTLLRDKKNNDAWNSMFRGGHANGFYWVTEKVSLGINGDPELAKGVAVDICRINFVDFWISVGLFTIYLLVVILGIIFGDLLRDNNGDLSMIGVAKVQKRAFSLGRVQMAIWTTVVLPSFLFIWLATTNYDIITPGVAGLMGISLLTAVSAAAIDNSKLQDTINKIKDLQKKSEDPAIDPKAKEDLDEQIDALKETINAKSRGFFKDICCDANGLSFHRVQMIARTIVLVMIFIESVYYQLVMPEFPAALLALQGISSGTYLGFKFPEKQG